MKCHVQPVDLSAAVKSERILNRIAAVVGGGLAQLQPAL